jgi:hypothetical protein
MIGLLARRADRLMASRAPDFIVGGAAMPYMLRWWVIPRNRFFNVYLHSFKRSDDDRALHDHPWFHLSIILRGRYVEHVIRAGGIGQKTERHAGTVKFRAPWHAHRVEVFPDDPCISLFITGPIMRTWGFHCPRGWVPWKQFVDGRDTGQVGQGCGDDAPERPAS